MAATCLEDLQASLDAIAAKLGVPAGTPDIAVSLESSATSGAASASAASASASALAIAYAEAQAMALALVDLDVRVNIVPVVELILPPVSIASPPVLVDFPSNDTQVTATPATTGDTGEGCQLISSYVAGVVEFLTLFRDVSSPLYAVSSALWQYLDINLKVITALALRFPIPKQVAAALVNVIVGVSNAGGNPTNDLDEAIVWLSAGGDSDIICNVLNEIASSGDSWGIAQQAHAAVDDGFPEGGNAAAILKLLFSPSMMAGVLFLPTWGVPSTSYDCGCTA